jgi:hypothetical protein
MARNDSAATTVTGPSQEAIAQRAHEIWESEGRPEGRAMEHWLRAVSELKAQSAENNAASRESNGHAEQEPSVNRARTTRRTAPRAGQKRFQPAGQ